MKTSSLMKGLILVLLSIQFNYSFGQMDFKHKNVWWADEKVTTTDLFFMGKIKTGNGNICFAKNSKRAFAGIKITNVATVNYVLGDLYIYTNNGNRVKCYYRNLSYNWNENGIQVAMGIYYLTFDELKMIEREGINDVHFVLSDYFQNIPYSFTGLNWGFIVDND